VANDISIELGVKFQIQVRASGSTTAARTSEH
jgi:hypothetical protein